jgi:hypothetical protein
MNWRGLNHTSPRKGPEPWLHPCCHTVAQAGILQLLCGLPVRELFSRANQGQKPDRLCLRSVGPTAVLWARLLLLCFIYKLQRNFAETKCFRDHVCPKQHLFLTGENLIWAATLLLNLWLHVLINLSIIGLTLVCISNTIRQITQPDH